MGHDPQERVLALPREYLFGLERSHQFNGFVGYQEKNISMPARVSAKDIDRWYAAAFELCSAHEQPAASPEALFHFKDHVDNEQTRPDNLVQIITYTVLHTGTENNFSVFAADFAPREDTLKGKKLGGRITVGWAEHITADFYERNINGGYRPDPRILLLESHIHVLAEEIEARFIPQSERVVGWIYLPHEDDGISPYHLAHVKLIEVPSKDDITVQPKELTKSNNARWLTLAQLEAQAQRLAPWSRVLLPELHRQAGV